MRDLSEGDTNGWMKPRRVYVPLLRLRPHRRANPAQRRLVGFLVEVADLTHDQHGAGEAVETARPAGGGEVEAEEADIVADGHFAGQHVDGRLRVQRGV